MTSSDPDTGPGTTDPVQPGTTSGDPPSAPDLGGDSPAYTAVVDQPAAAMPEPVSARGRFIRRFRRQPSAVAALLFLVVITVVAVAAPVLAPHDPQAQDLRATLQPASGDHLLGTDDLGRDVLSRLIFATRISLLAAAQAVAVAVGLGVLPGVMAGYLGGVVDTVVMRITDAVMSYPPLILAIALVGLLGPSLTNAMFAIGILYAPRFLRLMRGTVMGVREETFIEACRSVGCSTGQIITRHVLPNVLSPLLVQISLVAGFAMLAEASLSFLGLGVQPPDASWGSMLGRATRYMDPAPLQVVYPGLLLALTVLAFNVLGDGLRDSLGRETRRVR
jgi:peptide/nickel transport system permease protein